LQNHGWQNHDGDLARRYVLRFRIRSQWTPVQIQYSELKQSSIVDDLERRNNIDQLETTENREDRNVFSVSNLIQTFQRRSPAWMKPVFDVSILNRSILGS